MKLAVGVFVIGFSILLVAVGYVMLRKKGVFDETLPFRFYTKSAEALYIGMPVNYSGFEIGTIRNIELTDSGAVLVLFDIKKEHAKWIRRDTILRLEKPLIGSPRLDVFTTLESPMLEAGSTLGITVQDDINDIINKIEPVVKDLQNIVVSVNAMSAKLASDEGSLFVALDNLRDYSNRLVEDDALLTTLTGDANATRDLRTSLAGTKATVDALQVMLRDLNRSVVAPSNATMKQFDAILFDIQEKLDTLEGTVEAIGGYDQDLVELKGDIRTGVQKANNLIDRVDTMLGNEQSGKAALP